MAETTSLGWAVSDSVTMMDRSLKHTRRNIESLFVAFLLPVLMLLIFTYLFGGAIQTGTQYVTYVVPGVIILSAGYGASMTAMSVVDDLTNGIIERFRSMAIASSTMLTGHVVASSVRNLIATALVIGVAFIMGFRPQAGPLEWLAAAGLVLLYVVALSWLAVAMGMLASTPEGASSFTFFMLFAPYVSSAFVPIETMPSVLHPIAENQPVTPLIESVRGLLTDTPIGGSGWIAGAWCVGILVVSYVSARMLFSRRTAK